MRIEVDSPAWLLREGEPLRLQGARGVTVHCQSGCLWLTTTGQPEDIFLRPGECHTVNAAGLTLIEAVGQAQARLASPDSACRLRAEGPTKRLIPGWYNGFTGLPEGGR